MTIEELEQAIEGRKVIRHKGRCFINVRTLKEAEHYMKLGASTFPWPEYCPGYEVYLETMLDPMGEEDPETGEYRDLRRAFIMDHFRRRDGVERPHRLHDASI